MVGYGNGCLIHKLSYIQFDAIISAVETASSNNFQINKSLHLEEDAETPDKPRTVLLSLPNRILAPCLQTHHDLLA
jgi:hypothetical protein